MTDIEPPASGAFARADLAEGGPGTLVIADIADRPALAVAVVLGWILSGITAALVMARRGHVTRPLVALGIVFGPLFVGFALVNLLPRERVTGPVVLREPRALGGRSHVTVAVLGDPEDVIDRASIDHVTGPDVDRMELVWPVEFETADIDHESQRAARATLEAAAVTLDHRAPGLVLVPGSGTDAVRDYIEEHGADVIVATGTPAACDDLAAALPDHDLLILPDGRSPHLR